MLEDARINQGVVCAATMASTAPATAAPAPAPAEAAFRRELRAVTSAGSAQFSPEQDAPHLAVAAEIASYSMGRAAIELWDERHHGGDGGSVPTTLRIR